MPQTPITMQKFVGLQIQANSFSQVPDGSLERAENLVVTNDGILRKRRGFSLLVDAASLATPRALTEYSSTLLVAHSNVLAQVNRTTGALTTLAGAFVPSATKPRFALGNGNLYGTSSTGVRKVESLTSALLPAGIPPGLDVSITLSLNAGIQAPNSQMGYRVVFGRKDVSGNKVTGAPSELTIASNPFINSVATYALIGITPTLIIEITSNAHGLFDGDTVVLVGASDPTKIDGTWTVSARTVNTFRVTLVSGTSLSGTVKVGAFRTPTIQFSIPAGLSTQHFYQVYRTSGSSAVTVTASDDGQLITEANLLSAEVTAGFVTFLDDVENLFKGADLYTNPNQSGIQSSNYEPPLCDDIAFFKSCLFYANIESKHDLSIALVSVTTATFAATNYIEITSGVTTHRYVATTSAPTPPGGAPNTSVNWNFGGLDASGFVFFQLTNSTSTSVALSIAATAKSLCKAINRHAAGLVFAYYVSGPEDIPGAMRFTRRTSGSAFTVKSQNLAIGDNFSPELWNTNLGRTSTNTDLPNALAYSKPQEPEAVPTPRRSKERAYLAHYPSARLASRAQARRAMARLRRRAIFVYRDAHRLDHRVRCARFCGRTREPSLFPQHARRRCSDGDLGGRALASHRGHPRADSRVDDACSSNQCGGLRVGAPLPAVHSTARLEHGRCGLRLQYGDAGLDNVGPDVQRRYRDGQ